MREDTDVIISAATAGGKTEAAFLPLLSRVVTSERSRQGFDLLYVSPLKALINDQFRRLDELCEIIEVPVHRWHGDVSASAKAKARKNPAGVLLITPESLEAIFVRRGLEVPGLFGGLDAVVIDELHAMLGTERGVHLRSLLCRIETTTGRRVRRIGLSATLGDMALAAAFLRPEAPDDAEILKSASGEQELKLQLRGYVVRRHPKGTNGVQRRDAGETEDGEADEATERAIAKHLFEHLRGSQNLIFAGSRGNVELYADRLRRMSEAARLPNEFHAHHANLARDHREFVEARLKSAEEPTTAVCTSTLELGIDIGEVAGVAQIGPPYSVASMRQRLGRSGRRADIPATMRAYVQEDEIDARSDSLDALRLRMVQTVAMIDLLIDGWCEPPVRQALHLSTFVHQVLSVIAERNGATPRTLFDLLCTRGAFQAIDQPLFLDVLRCIGNADVALIEQSPDGTLLLGAVGERLVEHYGFYAVFLSPQEYRVVVEGRPLGTLPITFVVIADMTIIFSGRRWRVLDVDDKAKVIDVTPDPTGHAPRFGGDAGDVHDCVAKKMFAVYQGEVVPPYLDATARELLSEGRATFQRMGLDDASMVSLDQQRSLLFPWHGTVAIETLTLALVAAGLKAAPRKHIAIEVEAGPQDVSKVLFELSNGPVPFSIELAAHVRNLEREKYHVYLNRRLLQLDVASGRIRPEIVPNLSSPSTAPVRSPVGRMNLPASFLCRQTYAL